MKKIFVVHENQDIICARDSMDNAIAAAINRMAISGCLCEEFRYSGDITTITYRVLNEHETYTMYIEATIFEEGI
jgi:hypothetical protein